MAFWTLHMLFALSVISIIPFLYMPNPYSVFSFDLKSNASKELRLPLLVPPKKCSRTLFYLCISDYHTTWKLLFKIFFQYKLLEGKHSVFFLIVVPELKYSLSYYKYNKYLLNKCRHDTLLQN